MSTDQRKPIALPLVLPQPCPICGAKVILTVVIEWDADDGEIIQVEYECETEPDIDSDEWSDWHRGHYAMPYVDWLPWEVAMLRWLNWHYYYDPGDSPCHLLTTPRSSYGERHEKEQTSTGD